MWGSIKAGLLKVRVRWFLALVASVITTLYKYILCTQPHIDRGSLAGVVSLPTNNCLWSLVLPIHILAQSKVSVLKSRSGSRA